MMNWPIPLKRRVRPRMPRGSFVLPPRDVDNRLFQSYQHWDMSLNQQKSQKGIREALWRLNAATTGGVLGMVAGKVKTRDELLSVAAAVLIATPIIKNESILIGLAVAVSIFEGSGLLIRLRKWRVGVPRSSSDY